MATQGIIAATGKPIKVMPEKKTEIAKNYAINTAAQSTARQALEQKYDNEYLAYETLGRLAAGGKIGEPLTFPMDLDSDHFMLYNIVARDRSSMNDFTTNRILRSIALPIPSNLTVGYRMDYDNKGIGALGALAAGRMKEGSLGEAGNDLGNLVTGKVNDLANYFSSTKQSSDANKNSNLAMDQFAAGASAALLSTAAGKLAGKKGGGIAAAITGALTAGSTAEGVFLAEGLAMNPHLAVMFRGVGLREFAFQYKFVARNKSESDRIRKIIGVLNYHFHPSYFAGGYAFNYPEEFDIAFAPKIAPYLYKINRCVLKDFTVNYNGENMPIFFEQTGAPVSIEITMNFQETKILTKDDFDDFDMFNNDIF